ncbi:MAG: zinc ribbon domain-containing protein [Leptospira sp.]|nr:zinc ribbon domain-containing protein [Leptospira sp.]
MDFLLYFYYLIFGLILFSPFVLFHFKFQESESPFGKDSDENLLPYFQRKANALDSLKDLRSDFHSRKITEEEFQASSLPFLEVLDSIESEIKTEQSKGDMQILTQPKVSSGWVCSNCGSAVSLPTAKFCPECGTSRLA